MKHEDVVKLTRQMVAQSMGQAYMEENGFLEAIPVEKLVDVGRDITDADNTVEKATKALCALLAKFEVFEGEISTLFDDILVDRVEWGGFIERAKINFADIMEDPVFSVEDGVDYSEFENRYYQPKVVAKIYQEGKSIMIPISIQRATLTEAFRDYETMNSFVSKIRSKVRQTLRKAIDRYCAGLVMGAIAVSAKATRTAIYLLDDALVDGVEGITAETTPSEAMANPKFILYIAKKIAEVRDNMTIDSNVYNNGQWDTASRDNILYLLNSYTRSLKFDVKANTFNREDVGFGDYKSIPAWQAVRATEDGKGFDFATTSKVFLSADPTNKLGIGTGAVEIPNVVGLLFDKYALGLTVFKEYTTTNYVASADFWNEYIHSLTNQILDSDFPIVAFIVDRKSE